MNMTWEEIRKKYKAVDGMTYTVEFTYEDFDIETDTFKNVVITKTAEQVYQDWLEQKDLPPQPSEMELLQQEVDSLKEQQQALQESQTVQDMLIDDLVFEVIPSIEQQVQQGVEGVTLNNMTSRGGEGMAGYLARKIIDGRDYATVFKTNAYKQYQDEVDTILELEGRGDLIKRSYV